MRVPLVVVTPPARDYENETKEQREEQSERVDSAASTASINATPSNATAYESSEETPEYRMRVISAFWTYMRRRFPDSETETAPKREREAGDKGNSINRERKTRESSGESRTYVAELQRVPSPAQSADSSSRDNSSGFSSGCSNESSTCFAVEPSASSFATASSVGP